MGSDTRTAAWLLDWLSFLAHWAFFFGIGWEGELDQYSSASLRKSSEKQLKQTRTHYYKLIGAMKKAESKIDPVLNPLRDQVLFLKHNLNARAVASLQTELTRIETDVSRLIRDMEIAMNEADSFIQTLKAE